MSFWQRLKAFLFGDVPAPVARRVAPALARPTPRQTSPLPPAAEPPSLIDAELDAAAFAQQKPIPGKDPKQVEPAASDFLPISNDELRDAVKGRNLTRNPWFGRRDRIPLADDERTQLIDRSMIANGILSAEQLAEIHAVSAEMERLNPSDVTIYHRVAQTVQSAVDADKAARDAIKAQKKSESAARREARQTAIENRKATDIVFLGQGVSARLAHSESQLDQLAAKGLPQLSTPADVAAALGVSIPRLRWLTFHNDAATRVHYFRFEVKKKSGGTRVLHSPHRELAAVQRWVFREILTKLEVHDAAHGFVAGRSTLSNATPHAGKDVVVNLDLKDFFPSIHFPRVRSLFERAGYSGAVATILALICTESPRTQVVYTGSTYQVANGPRALPQGACTSPALSNLIALRLDRRLSGLAAKMGLTYTRYADDLTFSGGTEFRDRVGYLMARVRNISEAEGFTVNESKSRVLRRSTAQVVTGLVVNDRPNLPRAERRRLRAVLHQAGKQGLDAQSRPGRPPIRQWLLGMISYLKMVRPELGQRLRERFDALT